MKDSIETIIGRKPILEALQAGHHFEKIIIDQSLTGEIEVQLRKWCKTRDIPLQRLPQNVLSKFSRANHQGVIGIGSPIEYVPLENTIDELIFRKGNPVVVVLDQVVDVRNFGAIARSVEVLGGDLIVVPMDGKAMVNDFAVKASAGALLRLPVCRVSSLLTAIKTMKLYGLRIIATEANAHLNLHETDFSGPVGILMGSEEKGVRPHLIREVDERTKIPQLGQTESLNVSVATGIVLYEIARNRGFPK